MQIVIDIPEEKYNTIKNKLYCGIYDAEVYESIANGTPLDGALQEIRQEIEIQKKGFPPSADYYKAINRSLDIIDKHIKEIEE